MDAMRHLNKVDAAYVEYLDRKYGMFTRIMEMLRASGKGVDDGFGEAVSVIRTSPFKVHVTRTSEAPPQTNKHVG